MAVHNSGFFNAVDGDRTYSAEELGMMFDGVITDGIFKNYLSEFDVSITGNNIIVAPGRAWFSHRWIYYGESITFGFVYPETGILRTDVVVINIDNTLEVRNASIKVKTGANGGSYPVLINNDNVTEIAIAYIEFNGSSYTILNQKGTINCPYAEPLISVSVHDSVEHFSDINPRISSFYNVTYSGTDQDAPITDSGDWSWNVINIGDTQTYAKTTQIAFCPVSGYFSDMWIRHRHSDTYIPPTWTVWRNVNPDISADLTTKVNELGTTLLLLANEETQFLPTEEEPTVYAELTSGEGYLDPGWYIMSGNLYIEVPSSATKGYFAIRMDVTDYHDSEGDTPAGEEVTGAAIVQASYSHFKTGINTGMRGGTIEFCKPIYVKRRAKYYISVGAFSSINAEIIIPSGDSDIPGPGWTNDFYLTKIGYASGEGSPFYHN